jgi:hypothetical protein
VVTVVENGEWKSPRQEHSTQATARKGSERSKEESNFLAPSPYGRTVVGLRLNQTVERLSRVLFAFFTLCSLIVGGLTCSWLALEFKENYMSSSSVSFFTLLNGLTDQKMRHQS